MGRLTRPLDERFWEKVHRRDPDECWPWLAGLHRGYGWFAVTRSNPRHAHMVAYELTFGAPPKGRRFNGHHSCDHKWCCNPGHVRVVSTAIHAQITHRKGVCKNGHDLTDPANVYIRPGNGRRLCLPCKRQRSLDWYYRVVKAGRKIPPEVRGGQIVE